MNKKLLILAGAIGMILTFQNCGSPMFSDKGSESFAASTCSGKLALTYKNTYYSYLRQANRCVACHAEGGQAGDSKWFAAANFNTAYARFQSLGRNRVEEFASGNHRSPYSGPEAAKEIEKHRETWNKAEDEVAACLGSMQVVTTEKDIPATVTTVTSATADAAAAWTTMTWNLETDLRREAFKGKVKAVFSFEIRRVDLPGDTGDFFQVRNPTAIITAPAEGSPAAVPTFTFQRLMIRSNGGPETDFTAWRELNAGTNSTTGQNLTPGAGYFNLYVLPTDKISLQFEALLKGGLPITTDPASGGGSGLPVITYRDLMNASSPYGVFAKYCVSCHQTTRKDGGLSLSTYGESFNARASIISRVQNPNNPMPTNSSGGFMSQANRDIVQKWFDSGAPQ